MKPRLLLALLLALALASCLVACGGGSTSTAVAPITTSPAPSGSSTTSAAPKPSSSSTPSGSSTASETAAERHSAGAAAPFVKPQADNSIPTFGAEASSSDRAAAAAALRAYLAARAQGDWATACSGLAASVRKQVGAFAGAAKGKGCSPLYKALSSGAPAATRANLLHGPIVSLRIKGRSGFALFYGPKKQKYVMPMAAEGGAWKVTQLAPIAYPLGSETQTSP